MWAIQYRRYGGPEVLEVGKVPIGSDFVGAVVRTGGRVPGVEIGDRVWGYLGMQPPGRHAAAARYVAVRADRIAVAPSRVPLEGAAALPLAGITAILPSAFSVITARSQ